MFLIFLLLFGSSQKEGDRFPNKTVQSKKLQSPSQPTKTQNRRSFPKTDRVPACVGPNIHGGAEALRAGRLDVLDLFASFWIKPKRRRTAPKQNRSVKRPWFTFIWFNYTQTPELKFCANTLKYKKSTP
jgi:hypothetical protein